MRCRLLALAVAAASLLSACNFHATTSQSNAQLNAVAKAAFSDLATGRDDAFVARMSSANDPDQMRAQLPLLRDIIGDCPPPEPTVLGTQSSITNQGRFYVVGQNYPCPDRMVTATTTFITEGGVWKIQAFNVNATALPAPPAAEGDDAPIPAKGAGTPT